MTRRRLPRPVWAAVDVDLFTDPSFGQLKPAEQIAFIKAILWTTKNLTDGLIPTGALTLTGISRAHARRFIELELFERDDAGYHLVAWHKWQKPKEEWERAYSGKVEGGHKGAHLRWHKEPDPACPYCQEGMNVRNLR